MKSKQRGQPAPTKEAVSYAASHIEIQRNLQLDSDEDLFKPKRLSPSSSSTTKKKFQPPSKIALDGILGLASLMTSPEPEEIKEEPADWFQPFPICNSISWDILPTGLPFQGKDLMQASIHIYYQGRSDAFK
mmetsp:Transcript_9638/g.9596  ORF Transcript_9638/g.9596 Transcript_9638/m.9596 type:complete len:132 (+) Transcript_9638:1-396(+)